MARILGNDLDNILIGNNENDTVAGRGGNDRIDGGGGADYLLGNDGDDYMDGGIGKDKLFGGNGNDTMVGGAGADWLNGDFGADSLKGGSGNDTFYFNANTAGYDHLGNLASDTITDFAVGDLLVFDKYNETGPMMLMSAPSGYDELVFVQNGANVEVYVDLGGDSVTDYLAVTVLNAALADVQAASSINLPLLV